MSVDAIQVFSPVDGRLLDSYRITSLTDLISSMRSAREAAKSWAKLNVDQRLGLLSPLQAKLIGETDTIVDCLSAVTGKVKTEVLLGEIYPLLEMLRYYQNNAVEILAARQISTSPLAFPNATAGYRYKPYGVVVVISPWNFPFQLTLYPLLTALIAGNAVIFKTSELSLPVGELIMALLACLDLPSGLVQWVVGGPEIGKRLIGQRPDLVFFTGGLEAGREIMAAAAQHPVPVILELGGKDAMVVFADAQLDRAVNAAIYGAFCNAGQVCVSVERLYVEASIFHQFTELLCKAVQKIEVGREGEGDVGPICSAKQTELIEAHYRDALSKGASVSGELIWDRACLQPVVLWNVREDMRILREETFGPLLPVVSFTGESEAIEKVNACDLGLNASVWSRDYEKALRVADQLEVGNWAVNDVIKNIGHPGLPFGGIKNSGFGRYHGAEGLRSFCYTVSGLVSRSRYLREPNWFPYSDQGFRELKGFIDFVFGKGTWWRRIKRNWKELRAFRHYAGLNISQYWHNFVVFIGRKRY